MLDTEIMIVLPVGPLEKIRWIGLVPLLTFSGRTLSPGPVTALTDGEILSTREFTLSLLFLAKPQEQLLTREVLFLRLQFTMVLTCMRMVAP